MEKVITFIVIILTGISCFISGYKTGYEAHNSVECNLYVQESSYHK